jgi:predicted CopG family antitoxin
MASKNISIPEPVYDKLREEKREGESFGDVIDRLMKGESLNEFWGAWSDETAEKARDAIREGRDQTDEKLSERYR